MTYSILNKGKKIITSKNKEVISKILNGIEKYYKPEKKKNLNLQESKHDI